MESKNWRGICATIYYCTSGTLPPTATDRFFSDTLERHPPLTEQQFAQKLYGTDESPVPARSEGLGKTKARKSENLRTRKSHKRPWIFAAALAACLLLIIAGIRLFPTKTEQPEETVVAETIPEVTEPQQEEILYGIEAIANAPIGSYLRYGSFEQDGDSTNGSEPIEWLVLGRKKGRTLLLCRYVLEYRWFGIEGQKYDWETSYMRSYLNNEFLLTAFSSEERNSIQGYDPKDDKIFLLSAKQAEQYFASDESRICSATDYAETTRGFSNTMKDTYAIWYLRTAHNEFGRDVAMMLTSGYIDGNPPRKGNGRIPAGTRPAMWVDLH